MNLLVYAYNPSAAEHTRAAKWLEEVLWADEPVGTSWTNVLAFVRLTTSRIFTRPLSAREASEIVQSLFDDGGLAVIEPTERHWSVLRGFLEQSGARGNLVSDAHLAALAVEHGATLCTADGDFRRFKGLKVELPLG